MLTAFSGRNKNKAHSGQRCVCLHSSKKCSTLMNVLGIFLSKRSQTYFYFTNEGRKVFLVRVYFIFYKYIIWRRFLARKHLFTRIINSVSYFRVHCTPMFYVHNTVYTLYTVYTVHENYIF